MPSHPGVPYAIGTHSTPPDHTSPPIKPTNALKHPRTPSVLPKTGEKCKFFSHGSPDFRGEIRIPSQRDSGPNRGGVTPPRVTAPSGFFGSSPVRSPTDRKEIGCGREARGCYWMDSDSVGSGRAGPWSSAPRHSQVPDAPPCVCGAVIPRLLHRIPSELRS